MAVAPAPAPEPSSSSRPGQVLDWVLLGFIAALTVPFLVANATIFVFRRRKYFRAHGGADLILLGSFAGLVWITVSLVTNYHFPRKVRPLHYCTLWTYWLQLSLGLCLWLVCLILRLYRLFVLCTKGIYMSWKHIHLVGIPLLLSPSLIISIIATFENSFIEKRDLGNCLLKPSWKLVNYLVLPPVYFTLVVFLLFHLRKPLDYMLTTERNHTKDCCMMALVIYILMTVTYVSQMQEEVTGRSFMTFCICFLIFLHFWVRMSRPVYICLFKPELEMDMFEDELRWCGADCFNKLDNMDERPNFRTRSMSIHPSQLHDGDWLVRAINDAIAEQTELKSRKEELEQKLDALTPRSGRRANYWRIC